MTSKLALLLFVSLGFFHFSFAEEVCIKNGKELAAHKDAFPKFFQEKQEVRFARSQSPIAYFSFQVTEEKIFGQAKYKIPLFGIKQDRGYAKELCYDNQSHEIKIALDNGKEFKVQVVNDNPPEATVTIKGYELTRKPAEFEKAMSLLNSTAAPSASAPSSNHEQGGAQ